MHRLHAALSSAGIVMGSRGTNGLKLWIADARRRSTPFVDRPDAPEPDETVGEFLRIGREGRGESREDVARILRLQLAYVEAIEEGRWRDVPGRPYVHGYVRAYAEHLSADADAVLARLRKELVGVLVDRQRLHFPEPVAERRIPANIVMAVCVCLSLGGYFVWYQNTSPERVTEGLLALSPSEEVVGRPSALRPFPDAAAPSTLVPIADMAAEAEAARRSAVDERPLPAPAELAATLPPARLVPLPSLSSDPTEVAAATLEELPPNLQPVRRGAAPAQAASIPLGMDLGGGRPGQVAGDPSADEGRGLPDDDRVVLRAHDDSWIEVRAPDGAVVIAKLLRKGDSYSVPDRPGLRMTTGNAGALEVVVDGEPAPPLGTSGQVVRGIDLDGKSLLAGRTTAGR